MSPLLRTHALHGLEGAAGPVGGSGGSGWPVSRVGGHGALGAAWQAEMCCQGHPLGGPGWDQAGHVLIHTPPPRKKCCQFS